jgi:dihydrodipicolinate synthase/N-acetylneuraminate lyase
VFVSDYLVKYCKEVASVARNLPFYYYHFPGATGVERKLAYILYIFVSFSSFYVE